MDEHGGVAAVVEDHVRHAAAMPVEQLGGVVPVLVEGLALIGEDRDAGGGDGGGGMVLGRIDVAGDPADVGAESLQGLDQHRGLDGHVQRAGDAGALEGLLRAVFLADGHQARHLGLGDRDLLAAEIGEADVFDDVILCHGGLSFTRSVELAQSLPELAGRGNQDIKMSLYVSLKRANANTSSRHGRARPGHPDKAKRRAFRIEITGYKAGDDGLRRLCGLTRPRRTGWRGGRRWPGGRWWRPGPWR